MSLLETGLLFVVIAILGISAREQCVSEYSNLIVDREILFSAMFS